MECMEKSLGALINAQERPCSLPVALNIVVQIACKMRYIHDMGITHCDLKLDNLVVAMLALQNLLDFFKVTLIYSGNSKGRD